MNIPSSPTKLAWYVSLVAVALACGSCSMPQVQVTAKDVAVLPADPQKPIPMRAGLFVTDEIRTYNWGQMGYKNKLPWLTGAEIQTMIEQTARGIFKEVVPLTSAETTADFRAKNLDIVLSVGSMRIEQLPTRDFGDRLHKVEVVLQWDVSSPDGKRVFFCKPTGLGETKLPFPMSRSTAMESFKKSFVAALGDHFRKTATEVMGSAWWKDTSWRSK